jgi:hypothetical protein
MKKLENIPKKQVFEVPEGYFETLPGKIQARITQQRTEREPAFIFRYKLQYAVPLIILVVVGAYWYSNINRPADAESLLASVQTDELVAYLNDSDLTTEDLLESVEFNSGDLQEIETEVYQLDLEDEELDDALENIDIENI